MPTFSNAGGSLGSAIILTLLAWGVRWARAELGRRKLAESDEAGSLAGGGQRRTLSPFHARVSVKTLFGLLETRACKFLLIDVRPFTDDDFVDGALGETDVHGSLLPCTPRILSPRTSVRADRLEHESGNNGTDIGSNDDELASLSDNGDMENPTLRSPAVRKLKTTLSLPREFRGAIRLPYDLVGDVLSSREAWEATFPHIKCPDTFTMLVLLGDTEEQECRAASKLNALGYQRSLCVEGSIHALLREESELDRGFEMTFGKGPEVKYISRDGLATLLMGSSRESEERGKNGQSRHNDVHEVPSSSRHDFLVVDVRRRDEIILYGAIHGAKNVPIDQLASALSSNVSDEAFRQLYHFDKPRKDVLLVFCSRAFSRATWAAHVALDAGYSRVCVYSSGVCGWRLDPAVSGYEAYGLGDAPPSPQTSDREAVDHQRGFAELADLVVRVELTEN